MVKIGTVDPLSLLERKDKWFLGGGKGAIYAPPFPRWLEKPGFWDECFYADIKLTRLFTVLFCDSAGRPTRLRGELVSWRPDRMIVEHRSASHGIRETRLVTEDHEWVSVFELMSGPDLQAFVWSLPEMREQGYGAPWQSLTSCSVESDSISYQFATAWPAELEPDRSATEDERVSGESAMLEPLVLHLELGANLPRVSHTVNLAQRHDDSPLWETSLLPQKLRNNRLPEDFKQHVGQPPVEGLVHILQQYELRSGQPLVVWCRATLPSPFPKGEGAGGGGFDSVSNSPNGEGGRRTIGTDVISQNERDWREYFASVPQFSSSDPHLTAAYWYRWYGLRLNTVDIPDLPICLTNPNKSEPARTFSPFITEGVGFFRNFVTYSAQAHLREVAWMHSSRLGLGILENLAKCQREDGSFPGHNYSCRPARDFYHADFASGVSRLKDLHALHDLPVIIGTLRTYARYLARERSDPVAGILIFDQNETGQEYMSRYQVASEKADEWGSFRIGGSDATTYFMKLVAFLSIEEIINPGLIENQFLGQEEDELWHRTRAMELPWFGDGTYCADVLPDGTRSGARPASGFYPFLFGIANDEENWFTNAIQTINCWLLNPYEFWLPKGFPATALSDPTFSADAEWKDKRLNCPWNGRSWPMVNSHLVDAIANVARMIPSAPKVGEEGVGDGGVWQATNADLHPTTPSSKTNHLEEGELRRKAGETLMKAVTLMFHDGDPARPNSYEHYDPFTGTPSLYRGYDDYMHSWIVDLILRHAVGVQPGMDEVDPLPLGVEWIECTDIPHPRGRMSVRIEKDRVVNVSIGM